VIEVHTGCKSWEVKILSPPVLTHMQEAFIDTSCDSGTSTLENYYLNFIAWQLYAQKCPKDRKSQYWHAEGCHEPSYDYRMAHGICILYNEYLKSTS